MISGSSYMSAMYADMGANVGGVSLLRRSLGKKNRLMVWLLYDKFCTFALAIEEAPAREGSSIALSS